MWAVKGEVWLRLCVLECSTSGKDTTENGLLDDGQETCVLANRYVTRSIDVDFDVCIGVDEHNRQRRASEKAQFDAVAIKWLIGVKKKVPPTVADEVNDETTEDTCSMETSRKSHKKSGCYGREDPSTFKISFGYYFPESGHYIMSLLLVSCG